jgi:hypothetical protein
MRKLTFVLLGAMVVLLALPLSGRARDDARLSEHARPVASVFFIAKSQNRNEVHYGVHVDARCRLVAGMPVYGYWRDFERGPRAISPLLDLEQPAYGVSAASGLQNGPDRGRVSFHLRGLPERSVTVESFASGEQCRAWALTSIAERPAVLASIYVQLGVLFSVESLVLHGFRLEDGAPVQETIDD